jgi:hypothetical protein
VELKVTAPAPPALPASAGTTVQVAQTAAGVNNAR